MPFPSTINAYPAPSLEGAWASVNPHTSMLTPGDGDPTLGGYSAWKAGTGGVVVGRFAFANLTDGTVTTAAPAVAANLMRVGFVHRYHPVIISAFLDEQASMLYAGQEVDIVDGGDFWARFPNGGTPGQKVFASTTTGLAVGTAAAGGTVAGAIETRWYLDTNPIANGNIGKISTRG